MTTGTLKNKQGKQNLLYRGYTANGSLSATLYLIETQFLVGINNATPSVANTDLTKKIPIEDGTVNDDGSNTMTGSSGGDNSTDNTSIFKEGAGATDATAQNLIANNTNATKKWEIADLTSAGANCDATKYIGLWLKILDATALAKFLSSGTALEVRIGADTTSNYYSKIYEVSELAVGFNWLSNNAILSTWDVNGTPGTLNNFAIIITTNNATDEFAEGDIIYDLLRQWVVADYYKDFVSGYPTIDLTNLEATQRGYLNSLEANGFNLNGEGTINEDTTKLMGSESTYTELSKSSTDEVAFISVDRIR